MSASGQRGEPGRDRGTQIATGVIRSEGCGCIDCGCGGDETAASRPTRSGGPSKQRRDKFYQDRDGNWVKQGGWIEYVLHPISDVAGVGGGDGCSGPGVPGRRALGCENNDLDGEPPSDTLEIRVYRHRWVNACGDVSTASWCACADWSDTSGDGGADLLRSRSATLSRVEIGQARDRLVDKFDRSLDTVDREMLTHGWAWLTGSEQLQLLTRAAICATWIDLAGAKNSIEWANDIRDNLLFPDVTLAGGGGDNGLLSFWHKSTSRIVVDTDHDLWKVWREVWVGEHRVFSALWPWTDVDAAPPSRLSPIASAAVACGEVLTIGPAFDECLVRRHQGDQACVGRAIASDLLRTMMDAEKRALERGDEGTWYPKPKQGIGIENMENPSSSLFRRGCQPGFRAPNTLLWLLEQVAPIVDSNVCHDFGERPLQLGDCVLNSDFFHVFPTLCNTLTPDGKWRFMELDADDFCTPLFPNIPF